MKTSNDCTDAELEQMKKMENDKIFKFSAENAKQGWHDGFGNGETEARHSAIQAPHANDKQRKENFGLHSLSVLYPHETSTYDVMAQRNVFFFLNGRRHLTSLRNVTRKKSFDVGV